MVDLHWIAGFLVHLHWIAGFVVFIVFCYFLYIDYKNKSTNPNFPNLLVTLGIAFTFLGITLGLMDLDLNNTTTSLPQLINGIKTAFIGSLVGVTCSFLLKWRGAFAEQQEINTEQEKIDNFYAQHQQMLMYQKLNHDHLAEQSLYSERHYSTLANLLQQFEAFKDNCTISSLEKKLDHHNNVQQEHFYFYKQQLEKIHTRSLDKELLQTQQHKEHLDVLQNHFSLLSSRLTEQNQTILITAAENAMKAFNQQMMACLGDNFVHLNESIRQLNLWQKQYAQQLDNQVQQHQNSLDHISKLQQNYQDLIDQASIFKDSAVGLGSCIDSLQQKKTQLSQLVDHFDQRLETKLEHITQWQDQLESSLLQQRAGFKHIQQEYQQYLSQQLQELKRVQSTMQEEFAQTYQNLAQNIQATHQQQEEALQESLITLARQLGSISEKFAYDYTPITENIKVMMQAFEQKNVHPQSVES